jgi:hypothetical protein
MNKNYHYLFLVIIGLSNKKNLENRNLLLNNIKIVNKN